MSKPLSPAEQAWVATHWPLAQKVARKAGLQGLDIADAESLVALGLCRAATQGVTHPAPKALVRLVANTAIQECRRAQMKANGWRRSSSVMRKMVTFTSWEGLAAEVREAIGARDRTVERMIAEEDLDTMRDAVSEEEWTWLVSGMMPLTMYRPGSWRTRNRLRQRMRVALEGGVSEC